jgi:hypothetical protein
MDHIKLKKYYPRYCHAKTVKNDCFISFFLVEIGLVFDLIEQNLRDYSKRVGYQQEENNRIDTVRMNFTYVQHQHEK